MSHTNARRIVDVDRPPLGVVGGVGPPPERAPKASFVWQIERGTRHNYRLLGQRLADVNTDLYRHGADGHGLLQVLPAGRTRLISKAADLAPLLADSLTLQVTKDGKVIRELPEATHLNALLHSERFLRCFPPVEQVTRSPVYREDYSLVEPGYNPAERLLYTGPPPEVVDSLDTVHAFLDVMDFATNADRTNAIGAALTVLLRHHFPGGKPIVQVTATKSHVGKGTVTDFVCGAVPRASILYESLDWPVQQQLQRQLRQDSDVGVVVFDNVRIDSAGGRARCIRSAFLESFVTDPEVVLASPGGGEPLQLKNHFVVVLNTNDGCLSTDLLNRALPIHLAPKGDVHDRRSPIGNPKLEYLPAKRARIEAELRGLVERWRQAGCPPDEAVKHPMTPWARAVGGILQVNGFRDFLANYAARKTADDPIREALAILAAAQPGPALRPKEWARVAVKEGLAKTLFAANERDTEPSRERAIGIVLSRHLDETFEAVTEANWLRVRLEGGYRRWVSGADPHKRYIFAVLEERPLPSE